MAMSDGHHFLYEVVDGSVPRKSTISGKFQTDTYACGCEHKFRTDIPDDGSVTLCGGSDEFHLDYSHTHVNE